MSKTLDEELDKIFVEDYTNGLCLPLDDDAKTAIKRLIVQEKMKAVNSFVDRLNTNHNDMPLGTPRQYVAEQQIAYNDELEKELESE